MMKLRDPLRVIGRIIDSRGGQYTSNAASSRRINQELSCAKLQGLTRPGA